MRSTGRPAPAHASAANEGAGGRGSALRFRSLGTVLLYGASGALFGAAFLAPVLAPLAWAAVAALAIALDRTRSSLAAAAGVLAAHLLARMIAFPWMPAMFRLTLGVDASYLVLAVSGALVWTFVYPIVFGLGHRVARGRLRARWWLPVAWASSEALRFALLSVNIDDWLCTQSAVGPVLRSLALVGWWPLLLACLFAAASLGQALVDRRRSTALLGGVILGGLWLAPSIVDPRAERLEGIAAMHTRSTVALPAVVPAGVDVVLWPEDALDLYPALVEGPGGASIPPLLPEGRAEQIVGLVTEAAGRPQQNQAVAVAADGRVRASRAKRLLFPLAERRLFGVGRDRFAVGKLPPILEAGGRTFAALICGEYLSRALVAEGAAGGAEVLAILARERWATARARDQLLAVQILRSVEFGLPSVRASFGGAAAFVAADGRVLARSDHARNGLSTWSSEGGAKDVDFHGRVIEAGDAPLVSPDIAVLYSTRAPHMRTRCPEGRCSYHAIEGLACPDRGAKAVIVAGHGEPPDYLSLPAAELAAVIRCFSPEVVVIDACYGASIGLLEALGDLEAVVVASPSLLPASGLVYGRAFFESTDPRARAAAVDSNPVTELLRWSVDRGELAALRAGVEAMGGEELGAHLARRLPPTVKLEIPGSGPVLIPIAWERLGERPPPKVLRPRFRP